MYDLEIMTDAQVVFNDLDMAANVQLFDYVLVSVELVYLNNPNLTETRNLTYSHSVDSLNTIVLTESSNEGGFPETKITTGDVDIQNVEYCIPYEIKDKLEHIFVSVYDTTGEYINFEDDYTSHYREHETFNVTYV